MPPLGLEFIGRVIKPYTQALDIIDLRYESKSTSDFLCPETDMDVILREVISREVQNNSSAIR